MRMQCENGIEIRIALLQKKVSHFRTFSHRIRIALPSLLYYILYYILLYSRFYSLFYSIFYCIFYFIFYSILCSILCSVPYYMLYLYSILYYNLYLSPLRTFFIESRCDGVFEEPFFVQSDKVQL